VLCGCLPLGKDITRYLAANGARVDHLVSLSAADAERHSVANYAAYDDLAAELEIPLYLAESYALTGDRDLRFFRDGRFDVLLMGGWQRLFPEAVLKTLAVGGIGIHGSSEFLPVGRGRSPVNWSLIEGKRRFIQQLFLMQTGADDGDVISYDAFDINEWDDCHTLHEKSAIVSKRLMLEILTRLREGGTLPATPQRGEPSYYPKRTPEDGAIDWSRTVFDIYNLVRALTHPFPGAFSYLRGEKAFIWRAQPFDTRITYLGRAYGEVVERFESGEFVVNCHSGLLLVRECTAQPRVGDTFTFRLER
jgi:methionyl-tRNA formyltransferase